MPMCPQRSHSVLVTAEKVKRGQHAAQSWIPQASVCLQGILRVGIFLLADYAISQSLLVVKAHAEAHGESCALLSQFIHHLYPGKAIRREASYCPLPVTLIAQVQSWVCYVDVHFGDHCSSNFSPKVALVSCSCTPRLFTMTGMNPVNLTYRGCFTGHKEDLCSVQ